MSPFRKSTAIVRSQRLLFAVASLAACSETGDGQAGGRPAQSYFEGIAEGGRPNLAEGGAQLGGADASQLSRDAAVTIVLDSAMGAEAGAAPTYDAGAPDGGAVGDPVARGRYLVHHVAACVECHTPRDLIGRVDQTKLLSGVECFRDASPNRDRTACLHTGNLTNHETGLKNRSDLEIKAMFLEGTRPNGKALHGTMPYWVFGNMSSADADAIVAYLRTVPGISHMVPPSQPPFRDVSAPALRWPAADLPTPTSSYANQAAAQRGRYLAASVGSCIECHTPRNADGSADFTRGFRGGLAYTRDELGLPAAFFPATITTANLTPHADGLLGWTVQDVVSALKLGRDREGAGLCPPMPGGMGAFGGLTDQDAEDIAHYVLSLPAGAGQVVDVCSAPF